MPTNQTILWIVLPNGFTEDGTRLRLSIFVAPRLRTSEGHTLAMFPDFRSWPARMQHDQVAFTVHVENGPQVPATIVSPPPSMALWNALFDDDTPVETFTFDDHAARPIMTFPVQRVLDDLRGRYATIAAHSGEDLPRAGGERRENDPRLQDALDELIELFSPFGSLMEGVENEEAFSERLARLRGGARGGTVVRPQLGNERQHDYLQTLLFYHRPARAEPAAMPGGDEDAPNRDADAAAHFRETIDFHQQLAALGDYPALLGMLGLVFHLELPAEAIPQPLTTRLRVIPSWQSSMPPESSQNLRPWTAFTLARLPGINVFIAAPNSDSLSLAGFLNMGHNGAFAPVGVDIDGAALKTLNTAATLARQASQSDGPIDAPERSGLAALRSGGVAIVRNGNGAALAKEFGAARDANAQAEAGAENNITFFAEDVTRGFRLDVREDRTRQWRSLHERIGTYTALRQPDVLPDPIADEGFAQISGAGPASDFNTPPDPQADLYLHEAMFTWDGWSLSAPRPGASISRSARAPTEGEPETQPHHVSNRAATSMPLETSFKPRKQSLPRLRFGQGYQFRVRTVDLAGNGLTIEEADVRAPLIEQLANTRLRLPATSEYVHLRFEPVPPPVLVPRRRYTEGESLERMVIRSNFDASAADYAAAAPPEREYRAENERHVAPPKAALDLIEAHGMLDAALDAKHTLPHDKVPAAIASIYELARREKGQLADMHAEEQVTLPYLPDPLADAALVRGLPGAASSDPLRVPFDAPEWFRAQPFRVQLLEGGGAPDWNAAARVLTVHLPKAGVATVKLNSHMGGDLELMGLWAWCDEAFRAGRISAHELDTIAELARAGRHWMFTPFRELTFVHAVQQPLLAPEGHLEVSGRAAGETYVHLRGELHIDAASSSQLDVQAAWHEPRDVPGEGVPKVGDEMPRSEALAFQIQLPPPRLERQEALQYLPDEQLLLFDTAMLSEEKGALATPHVFGDTRYRRVTYTFVATSRFREYFAPEIASDPHAISRHGTQTTLDIMSSARPSPPKVRQVVPTFRWERTRADDGTMTSVRRGGGLRVYLERPWFSSGEGEQLGVVLAGQLVDADELPYATVWGRDPIWRSAAFPGPDRSHFANALSTTNLRLPELRRSGVMGSGGVTVVGFPVEYDPARDLWFADIDLELGDSYFPFVRLALARYQPHSLREFELSPVVLADWAQPAPDRTVTVAPDLEHAGRFAVSVSGPGFAGQQPPRGPATANPNIVEVGFERRNPAIPDDMLAWERLPATAIGLAPDTVAAGVMTWHGMIQRPTDEAGELRLSIREYEPFLADDDTAGTSSFKPARRLVFAEAINL